MFNQYILNRLQLAATYLELLNDANYSIIDLNMVEPFVVEDKKFHPSNIVFERNYEMQAIRSDWTRSILNYRRLYHLPEKHLGYFGPIIRNNQTIYQAGAEIYEASTDDIIQSMLLHFKFIENQHDTPIQTLIVNDEKLIDLYLKKYALDHSLKELIYDKDVSSLKEQLGENHPLYQLMIVPVSKQYSTILDEFDNEPIILAFKQLYENMQDFQFKFILDLSFRSPQRYYNGFYFQIFLDEAIPVLSGGQYDQNAFGIAINLSNGGLI